MVSLVKILQMSDRKIEIVAYQQLWCQWFEELSAFLADGLGDLVMSIDHIGSTSVPGLGAKSRLDVQLTVESLRDSFKKRLDSRLERMDFAESIRLTDHKPPWDDREGVWDKLYVKGGNSGFDFPMNIHIRKQGNPNQEYPLLFRDYLREHSDSAQAYYRLKCELARHHPDDIDAYCDIKDPACDLIMVAARDWANRVGWKVSLSQGRGE